MKYVRFFFSYSKFMIQCLLCYLFDHKWGVFHDWGNGHGFYRCQRCSERWRI